MWIGDGSIWAERWYWAETPIHWFEGWEEDKETLWFDEHGRSFVKDSSGDEEGFDYLMHAVTDTVMAALLGNMTAVKGVETKCVNLLPTVARGAVG